jgi:hypothetical protein
MAKGDRFLVDVGVVQSFGHACTQCEWQQDASSRDGNGRSRVPLEEAEVGLHADDEEEQAESDCGNQVEVAQRLRREDLWQVFRRRQLLAERLTFSVKPGMRPKTDGPRRMPASTSAMTLGWRILPRKKARMRASRMIKPAWMANSTKGSFMLKRAGEWCGASRIEVVSARAPPDGNAIAVDRTDPAAPVNVAVTVSDMLVAAGGGLRGRDQSRGGPKVGEEFTRQGPFHTEHVIGFEWDEKSH